MDPTRMGKNKVVAINEGKQQKKKQRLKVEVSKGAGIQIRAEMVPDDTCAAEVVDGQRKYCIGPDHTVTVLAADAPEPPNTALIFSSFEELVQGTAKWPMRQLVSVWHQLPGSTQVSRFEKRSIALARLWRAIEKLELPAIHEDAIASAEEKSEPLSKTQRVIDLLQAPDGATLAALMEATGWQAHSVRGFLSGKLSKQMGLPVASFRRDGERVYVLKDASVGNGEEK